jgi:hypothetical protein
LPSAMHSRMFSSVEKICPEKRSGRQVQFGLAKNSREEGVREGMGKRHRRADKGVAWPPPKAPGLSKTRGRVAPLPVEGTGVKTVWGKHNIGDRPTPTGATFQWPVGLACGETNGEKGQQTVFAEERDG